MKHHEGHKAGIYHGGHGGGKQKGKDSIAHSSKETHANPHGPMPSIAHGYAHGEEYEEGGDGAKGQCNEKEC